MTRSEWLTCTDPVPMLLHVGREASDRKLRLFACACCRRAWDRLGDERSRQAVEVAERHAGGLVTGEELEAASDAACAAWDDEEAAGGGGTRLTYTHCAAAYNVTISPGWWGGAPAFVAPDEIIRRAAPDPRAEGSEQCALVREILGDPFRVSSFDPSWRTPKVVALARSIYEDRGFDRMPSLADLLEEAGCTELELLAHCRGPGEHARGCWALDIILAYP